MDNRFIIDEPLSGSPSRLRPPLGIDLKGSQVCIQSLPPGGVRGHFEFDDHLIDLHFKGAGDLVSVDSDRLRPFDVVERTVGVIPAGCDLRLVCHNQEPNLLIWITPGGFDQLELGKTKLRPKHWGACPETFQFGEIARREVAKEAAADNLLLETAALSIIARMADLFRDGRDAVPKSENRRVGRALEYIAENLHRNIDLSEISNAACLSPFHFSRIFKAHMGMSPHSYVIMRRVERASVMLRSTRDSLAVIAHECGFSSQAHMTTMFARTKNITPAAYRRGG